MDSSSGFGSGIIMRNTETPAAVKRFEVGMRSDGAVVFRLGEDAWNQPSPMIFRYNRNVEVPNLTADRAMVSGPNKELASSAVTATELGRLAGVTRQVQSQLNALNQGVNTRLRTDLTTSDQQVVMGGVNVQNASGQLQLSTPAAWVGMAMINNANTRRCDIKMDPSTGALVFSNGAPAQTDRMTLAANGDIAITNLTADRAIYADGSKQLKSSAVTTTELSYLSGVTSPVQTQLNAVVASINTIAGSKRMRGRVNINEQIVYPAGSYTNIVCAGSNITIYLSPEWVGTLMFASIATSFGTMNHHVNTTVTSSIINFELMNGTTPTNWTDDNWLTFHAD